jgi:hypothetical protein
LAISSLNVCSLMLTLFKMPSEPFTTDVSSYAYFYRGLLIVSPFLT